MLVYIMSDSQRETLICGVPGVKMVWRVSETARATRWVYAAASAVARIGY